MASFHGLFTWTSVTHENTQCTFYGCTLDADIGTCMRGERNTEITQCYMRNTLTVVTRKGEAHIPVGFHVSIADGHTYDELVERVNAMEERMNGYDADDAESVTGQC